jgi:hypothetical protein
MTTDTFRRSSVRSSKGADRCPPATRSTSTGDLAGASLPWGTATEMLNLTAAAVEGGTLMGDKSPKSKQRDQKQKKAVKARGAASAKSKQDGYSTPSSPKGKK